MRVAVTGAGGQLGRELMQAHAAWGHNVTGWVHSSAPGDPANQVVVDVTSRDQVLVAVAELEPDVIVHTAAWTDVDGCQQDPQRAMAANGLGTRNVAEAARLVGARVCYVSTDYVFDGGGDSGGPGAGRIDCRPGGGVDGGYWEADTPNPLSVYGRTKLAGEAELDPGATVVRTSWVCGRHGRNFVRTVLGRTGQGIAMKVVDDQFGCPTFADDLAALICRLVAERRPGLFHVTNQGYTSWFGLACETVAAAGLDESLITSISTDDLVPARPAPRPRWSVLDNAALRASGLPELSDYHEPLERLVKELCNS